MIVSIYSLTLQSVKKNKNCQIQILREIDFGTITNPIEFFFFELHFKMKCQSNSALPMYCRNPVRLDISTPQHNSIGKQVYQKGFVFRKLKHRARRSYVCEFIYENALSESFSF